MRDRTSTIGPMIAVAGALGFCCGLPVLLSLGVVGAIAGWSLQSWALVGLGLGLTSLGWARLVRRRRHVESCLPPPPEAGPFAGEATIQATSAHTDATENHS